MDKLRTLLIDYCGIFYVYIYFVRSDDSVLLLQRFVKNQAITIDYYAFTSDEIHILQSEEIYLYRYVIFHSVIRFCK